MNQVQWFRKLFHFAGIVIPLIYFLTDKRITVLVTVFFLILVIIVEVLRAQSRTTWVFLDTQLKEGEKRGLTGSIFFVAASLCVVLLFDKAIAVASLSVLCIADPSASIIGITWGRRPFFGKSVEGTAVFFLVSLILLAFFPFKIPAMVGAALIATAAELFSTKIIDDNLTIPISCAIALAVFARIF